MPIFEYECGECGAVTELLVGVGSGAEEKKCRACGSKKMTKLFSAHAAPSKSDIAAGGCAEAGTCPHAAMCGKG